MSNIKFALVALLITLVSLIIGALFIIPYLFGYKLISFTTSIYDPKGDS